MINHNYYGMKAEFGGLCVDFGHVSLNKKKETLCGDYYTIVENENKHVLVLSDGLGSGVKANIMATLTAKMLSNMIINHVSIEEAVRVTAKTLPICSVRQMAYATFTVLDIEDDRASLFQFDNPDAILIRNGKVLDYPYTTFEVEEKQIHHSVLKLQDEDMLIIMSDGVTNAGMGKTTDGGWGRPDVARFCGQMYKKGMSAKSMACALGSASVDLNLNETDDDITAIVLRIRKKQTVNLMIGPPKNTEDDARYLKTFFETEGYHVICGGTTAQFAAKYLGKEVKMIQDSGYNDVPARSRLEGAELVTEGFLTIERLLEYCDEWLFDPLSYRQLAKEKDAAALLGKMLFDTATDINVFFGNASNPNHGELNIAPNRKEEMVQNLIRHLKKAGKNVRIALWAV